jgi:hypothetical protein
MSTCNLCVYLRCAASALRVNNRSWCVGRFVFLVIPSDENIAIFFQGDKKNYEYIYIVQVFSAVKNTRIQYVTKATAT